MPSESIQIEDFLASLPSTVRGSSAGEVVLAAEDDAKGKAKRVKMNGYNGGKMNVGFGAPVVVNLAGLSARPGSLPILFEHDPERPVGHAAEAGVKIDASGVNLDVEMSVEADYAERVAKAIKAGYPYRASIGLTIESRRFVASAETAELNGQTFEGPILVIDRGELFECSFVSVPADASTSTSIAARAAERQVIMDGQNGKPADDGGNTKDQNGGAQVATASQDTGDAGDTVKATAGVGGEDQVLAAQRKAQAAEHRRISDIQALARKFDGSNEIIANAIEKGWSAEKAELECRREAESASPAGHGRPVVTGGGEILSEGVLSAALGLGFSRNVEAVVKAGASEEDAKKARQTFGATGITRWSVFLRAAAAMHGQRLPDDPTTNEFLRAAFSTQGVSEIVRDAANKEVARHYEALAEYRAVCEIGAAPDFKAQRSIRMSTDGTFDQVGPDGELKHATIGDTAYTTTLGTYGNALTISRQNIINDDAGVFGKALQQIARVAAMRVNRVVFSTFLDTVSLWTSGNGNLLTGAANALNADDQIAALDAATKKMQEYVGEDGEFIGAMPDRLIVPPALGGTARAIYNGVSTDIAGDTDAQKVANNPFRGMYQPVVCRYLAASSPISGGSDAAWYLLDSTMPVVQCNFLNGREGVTIEEHDRPQGKLGLFLDAYIDVGAGIQNPLGGLKVTGEAA